MDTIERLKNLIESHDLNKAQIAKECGMSKERFHYFLNYGKTCDVGLYAKIRKSIEKHGIQVDDLDTMSITGLAAHVNSEASKLISDCIQSLEDGILTEEEKHHIKQNIDAMVVELKTLRAKL